MRRRMNWLWLLSMGWVFCATAQEPATLDLEFDQLPLNTALQMIAKRTGANIIADISDEVKVTAHLKGVTLEQALDFLTRPKGFGFRQINGCYVVGSPEALSTWGGDPPAAPPAPQLVVYQVRFSATASLLNTLKSLYPNLMILPGIPPAPPNREGSQSSGSGEGLSLTNPAPETQAAGANNSQSPTSGAYSSSPIEISENVRSILLYGPPAMVEAALETAKQLDRAPIQIKIEVIVTDISRNSLKELGLEWDWSKFGWQELVRKEDKDKIANETLLKPSDKGGFWRTPISVEATLKALERKGYAKLLAHPSVSVLDGETAQIIIGDRVLYPVVVGTTTAGTPIFDVREQNVGIVLHVRAVTEPEGTITLDIYPQVSVIVGYLTVGDSRYPQIATRELRTKIRVKDGDQIALGGLIRDEETRTFSQVPILSKIPILGELFKSRGKSTTQNELMIFLKPEIIKE